MQTTKRLLGASRLPLTTKRGNKDYYKGTRQAFVPGESRRTGPPGKHVLRGQAKYRILDEQVRYFVSPGPETLRNTELRPYVFAPEDPTPLDRHRRSEARQAALEAGEPDPDPQLVKFPAFYPRAKDYAAGPNGGQAFAKWYRGLREEERQAMIMETRRRWWEGMVRRFGRASHAEEVEGSEGDGSQQAGPSDGSEKPGGL